MSKGCLMQCQECKKAFKVSFLALDSGKEIECPECGSIDIDFYYPGLRMG